MEYRVCRNNPAPYNDLNGKISLLGLGTMRLPLRDAADQTSIDEEKAQEIFDYAYAHGVNYFDTSPVYWLNLQRNTDLWESLDLHRDDLERIEPLALGMVG